MELTAGGNAVHLRARSSITSSRTSTCATAWTATARAPAMSYRDACDPDRLADAVTAALAAPGAARPVETDGAARAAAMLAELL